MTFIIYVALEVNRRNRSFCYRRTRGENSLVDTAVCLMYNLFLITLTFGVFICLQVILYKRDQSLFIDVLCIHTHVLRMTVTQGF